MFFYINADDKTVRAKAYARHRYVFFFINLAATVFFLLIFHYSGISLRLRWLSEGIGGNFFLALFLYLTVFICTFHLVTLPLSFYQGYVVEHRFELSNQSLSRWIADYLKRFILSYVFMVLIIEVFYYLMRALPDMWWLAAAVLWFLFAVIMRQLFPVLIIPLFYKYRPITNVEIREKIFELAAKAKMQLFDVCEIDLSKDTKKANAALTGLGKSRRVLLADTLLARYTPEEIEVVMAHEFAHHILKHAAKILVVGAVLSTTGFFIMQQALGKIAVLLHIEAVFAIDMFPFLYLVFLCFNLLTMPISNGYSRYLEKKADLFALELTGLRDSFISCMQRLAQDNLADPDPGRWIEIFFYNHPPIGKRIAYAKEAS